MGDYRHRTFSENIVFKVPAMATAVRASFIALCFAVSPNKVSAATPCFNIDNGMQVCPSSGNWLSDRDSKSDHLLLYSGGFEVEIWNQLPVENKTNLDRTAHAFYIVSAQRGWRGRGTKLNLSDPAFPRGTVFLSSFDSYRKPMANVIVAEVPLPDSTLFLMARGLVNPYNGRLVATLVPLISGLRTEPASEDGATANGEVKTDGQ